MPLPASHAAIRSVGAPERAVVAVSSIQPARGIDQLVAALEAHRERVHIPARRVRARRAHALSDFVTEYGERGLRMLGGRRAASAENLSSRGAAYLERPLRSLNQRQLRDEPARDPVKGPRDWDDHDAREGEHRKSP